ncbi:hypothetical protein AA309_11090 [Microvirga vignae]|uniref:Uncharacterized protein n=1 Tax=Microvirga vignae TaxID=1225564 RepID=A0A0H1RDE4_9HYPH|nr:AAA family ATPase [Microvirga vignae]KLK93099.1 hypothetical protein AA309_11090 [Microvirga vignae]
MILKRVNVKNFRSIRETTIEINKQTAILGANGAGKSTLLRAIDRFYGQSTTVELDDFFGRKTDGPIEIALTFSDFSREEREIFASHIHCDEMSVVRIFEAAAGRNNGRYYGMTLQHAGFAEIRAANGAQARNEAYRKTRESDAIYETLPAVRRADDIPGALQIWETQNPHLLTLQRDDGQFFGFTNVAKGSLQKSTNFVFIPAVRDASADAVDGKGAVIARLMELVVRSAVLQREDVKTWQRTVSEQYRELTDPSKLQELGLLSGELTKTLQVFYAEAGVTLRWQAPNELEVPLPNADVFLDDDGFEGPVDKKGHGLQRAFVLTLLQHLTKAVAAEQARLNGSEQQGNEEDCEIKSDVPLPSHVMPGLILAVEEPELYQHPTKQRHFAKVLSSLCDGSLPGVATQTQVIFASHSALFVSIDRFDEIRLARRHRVDGHDHKECHLTSSTLESVARRLEKAWQRPEGSFSPDTLRVRLHTINTEVAEGFFADGVVLVEGVSDRAAIFAAASLKGIDLEALGIAVLPVDGKTKLDKPSAIFSELEIPTFVIWDCDRNGQNVKQADINRALMRLVGRPEALISDALSAVEASYACFEQHLEATLREEIGSDLFDGELEAARAKFGMEARSDVQKTPRAMKEVLEACAKQGRQSGTLASIVEAIAAIRD